MPSRLPVYPSFTLVMYEYDRQRYHVLPKATPEVSESNWAMTTNRSLGPRFSDTDEMDDAIMPLPATLRPMSDAGGDISVLDLNEGTADIQVFQKLRATFLIRDIAETVQGYLQKLRRVAKSGPCAKINLLE